MPKHVLPVCATLFALVPLKAHAGLLDFEDLPDLAAVGAIYSTHGVHFTNAVSLTAGFSLNELDYPPSSGIVAIGDDLAPIDITFDSPAEDISAYFTYASQLTFTAYDAIGTIIGTYVNPGFENLGSTELISLAFTDVSSFTIAGEWDGSYIMDGLSFTLSPTGVPEPSTLLLAIAGFLGVYLPHRRAQHGALG